MDSIGEWQRKGREFQISEILLDKNKTRLLKFNKLLMMKF